MRLHCEELVSDKKAEVSRVLSFLTVGNCQELFSRHLKINPEDIREVTVDVGGVVNSMNDTKFEYYLDRGDINA